MYGEKPLPNSKSPVANFLTCTGHDWKPGNDERQQAVSGKVLDHSAFRVCASVYYTDDKDFSD